MIGDRNRLFIEHSPKEILVISARLLMTMCLIALANLAVFGLFVLRGQISAIFGYFTLTLLSITAFCAIFIYLMSKINQGVSEIDSPQLYSNSIEGGNLSVNIIASTSGGHIFEEDQRKDSLGVVVLTKLAEHLLNQREVQAVENVEVFVTYNYQANDKAKKGVESFLRPIDLTEITVYEVVP